jgi:hypothetical protein
LKNTRWRKSDRGKRKNQSLISLVQGKEPLDDRSTVENQVIEKPYFQAFDGF